MKRFFSFILSLFCLFSLNFSANAAKKTTVPSQVVKLLDTYMHVEPVKDYYTWQKNNTYKMAYIGNKIKGGPSFKNLFNPPELYYDNFMSGVYEFKETKNYVAKLFRSGNYVVKSSDKYGQWYEGSYYYLHIDNEESGEVDVFQIKCMLAIKKIGKTYKITAEKPIYIDELSFNKLPKSIQSKYSKMYKNAQLVAKEYQRKQQEYYKKYAEYEESIKSVNLDTYLTNYSISDKSTKETKYYQINGTDLLINADSGFNYTKGTIEIRKPTQGEIVLSNFDDKLNNIDIEIMTYSEKTKVVIKEIYEDSSLNNEKIYEGAVYAESKTIENKNSLKQVIISISNTSDGTEELMDSISIRLNPIPFNY